MDKLTVILANPDFWRGLAYTATAVGITLKPDQLGAIMTAVTAFSGVLHVFESSRPPR